MLTISGKTLLCLDVPKAAPVCFYDRSTVKMKLAMERWSNDSDGEKT